MMKTVLKATLITALITGPVLAAREQTCQVGL